MERDGGVHLAQDGRQWLARAVALRLGGRQQLFGQALFRQQLRRSGHLDAAEIAFHRLHLATAWSAAKKAAIFRHSRRLYRAKPFFKGHGT